MKKISVIFGTRPEAIKLAPVILALRTFSEFDCDVCITAQHREMLDQVLETFGIVPDTDLNLMNPNQSLAEISTRAIEGLDKYLNKKQPNLVMIQGDTTTVFCAALAAYYHHIPVAHVEAGLRTGNLYAPWPEEANRVLTSRLSSLHFAPTEISRQNLLREGIGSDYIYVTGNTVIDALFFALDRLREKPSSIPGLPIEDLANCNEVPIVLITGHRRESFGKGFESICLAIGELARQFPETHFVYPVHLNPNVGKPVWRILGGTGMKNIHLINPLPYLSFVSLMNRANLILTDSGGVQEEAPSLGKPVLVMRDSTERPEAIEAGTAKLVGTNAGIIIEETARLLTDYETYKKMAKPCNPFGDGHAADRIVNACAQFLENVQLHRES